MTARRAVLLDRDGTINVERHYLRQPDEVELLDGAAEGLRELQRLGFLLVVVTNQSGLARGYLNRAVLDQVHERLKALLAVEGVVLDGVYVCPHHPDDGCDCRKPKAGLVLQAARDLGFDPGQSFVIGDKPADLGLGRSVGAVPILVRTGYGRETEQTADPKPDLAADNLAHAARLIEARLARPEGGGSGSDSDPNSR